MKTYLLNSARALVMGGLALGAVGAAATQVYVGRVVNPVLRDTVVIAGLTASAASTPCDPDFGCDSNAQNTISIPALYRANKVRSASGQTPYTYDQAGWSAYQANGNK